MLEYLASVAQIIMIDIVLSGDNAVVIAMAAHKLPAYQRQRAILWGGGIAIFLRIVFTAIMAFLLMIPGVRLVGGIVLTWIACKLLLEEEEHEITPDNADQSAMAAIRMIFIADFVMSLDNMLAVAGASHGDLKLLFMGLLVSIAIIMTCSSFIARLMNRFKWITFVGAAILAFTAGEMMLGDREVASFIVRNYQVSFDGHWEEQFMTSHAHITSFDPADPLPEELRNAASFVDEELRFIGRISEAQRDLLLARVSNDADRAAIEKLYDQARFRPAPGWVPESARGAFERWFQMKWTIEDYHAIQGRKHHYVAWIFYTAVVAGCVTAPWWFRKKKDPAAVDHNKPAA
jgi:YjbE family integral membrane protein